MKPSGDLFFDVFWKSYPKRVGKLQAFKEWRKLRDFTIKDVLDGIERWKQSAQWQDLQFVPDPERFLKYRRWEDEVPVSSVRPDVYVGQGPVCPPGAVRPEVLERIRRREEQKAQIARKG